jgi:hypothetical protein
LLWLWELQNTLLRKKWGLGRFPCMIFTKCLGNFGVDNFSNKPNTRFFLFSSFESVFSDILNYLFINFISRKNTFLSVSPEAPALTSFCVTLFLHHLHFMLHWLHHMLHGSWHYCIGNLLAAFRGQAPLVFGKWITYLDY